MTYTTDAFSFLEKQHGYKLKLTNIENIEYFPDAEAVVKYVSSNIEIEVFWYFASAVVGVVFIELKNGDFPSGKLNIVNLINLYSLLGYLNQGKDNTMLLKDTQSITISKIKKREKIINENMKGVLENLAEAVRTNAIDIITGDTTIFAAVQKYQIGLM